MSALNLCAFYAGQHNQCIQLTDHAIISHFGVGNHLNLFQTLHVLLQLAFVGADVCIDAVHLQFQHLLLRKTLRVCFEDFLQSGQTASELDELIDPEVYLNEEEVDLDLRRHWIAVFWKIDLLCFEDHLLYPFGVFQMEVQIYLCHFYFFCLFELGKVIIGGLLQEGDMAFDQILVSLELIVEMSCQDLSWQYLHKIAQESAMKLQVDHVLRLIKIAFGDLNQLEADLPFLVVDMLDLKRIADVDDGLILLFIQVEASAITVNMLP